jgi:hypothetical protein
MVGFLEELGHMALRKKTVQLRMPAALYTQARHVVDELEEVGSFNEFAVRAIKEKVRRIEEAKIDEAFARMGQDPKYVKATADVFRDFADNDRDTLNMSREK